jgi:CO/xanthine dehydrogenase Mo-binding subunit
VANAIAAATGGLRLRRLPMTPERVWRAIEENGDGQPG